MFAMHIFHSSEVCFGVAVAQLVEPQVVILLVVGSSPIGHPQAYFVFTVVLEKMVR